MKLMTYYYYEFAILELISPQTLMKLIQYSSILFIRFQPDTVHSYRLHYYFVSSCLVLSVDREVARVILIIKLTAECESCVGIFPTIILYQYEELHGAHNIYATPLLCGL